MNTVSAMAMFRQLRVYPLTGFPVNFMLAL